MSAMGDYTLSGGVFDSPGGALAQCPQWGTIPCLEELRLIFLGLAILFIVISGFRVLISGIYVSSTFTIGMDIYMSLIVAW